MESRSRLNKPQSHHLELAVDADPHLHPEVVALREVSEGQEEVIMVLQEVECHLKEDLHLAVGAPHLKDLPLLALSAVVV